VRLGDLGRSSFRYEYEVVDVPTQRVVLTAKTVQVHFNYDTQTPVEMSEGFRRRLTSAVP
jgi:acyl-CoA thioesterase FadM